MKREKGTWGIQLLTVIFVFTLSLMLCQCLSNSSGGGGGGGSSTTKKYVCSPSGASCITAPNGTNGTYTNSDCDKKCNMKDCTDLVCGDDPDYACYGELNGHCIGKSADDEFDDGILYCEGEDNTSYTDSHGNTWSNFGDCY